MLTIYKYIIPSSIGQKLPAAPAREWLAAYGSGLCSCEPDRARIISLKIMRCEIVFESHDEFSEARLRELTLSLKTDGLDYNEAEDGPGEVPTA